MPYLRTDEARAAFHRSHPGITPTAAAVKSLLRKRPDEVAGKTFEVFLSHSMVDAVLIAGVKAYLESQGLTVYVDWMEDAQLDRSRVTPATADLLRRRMRASGMLIYAASESSPDSKWMPWELGYFDGLRQGRVAILPLVVKSDSEFKGQEYLGLYPKVEKLPTKSGESRPFVTQGAGSGRYMNLSDFRAGSKAFTSY
jgi:hypothetical protein